MAEFRMPSLGADMEDGTLMRWRRAVGDRVERDDVIAEVETDKGLIEIEVFAGGVIERLLVEPGQKVPVGAPLAIIREDREVAKAPAAPVAPVPAPSAPAEAVAATAPAEASQVEPPSAPAAAPFVGAPRASPRARRMARDLGVDLATLRGSGPGGVIEAADVERAAAEAAAAPKEAPPSPKEAPLSPKEAPLSPKEPADAAARMRRAIAAAMSRSKREVPHFYLATTLDLGGALSWLARENEARSVTDRLLPAVLLLKATALALRDVPELNARWEADEAKPAPGIHLGVAVSLRGGGLVAPAIHDADKLPLGELMAAFKDLVERARSGALRSSELSEPTITVTSLGERGVETVFPVIFPPQVAIVGFGKIAERPWVVDGQIAPRPLVNATLAADHRVTDGHRAARLLTGIDARLKEPGRL